MVIFLIKGSHLCNTLKKLRRISPLGKIDFHSMVTPVWFFSSVPYLVSKSEDGVTKSEEITFLSIFYICCLKRLNNIFGTIGIKIGSDNQGKSRYIALIALVPRFEWLHLFSTIISYSTRSSPLSHVLNQINSKNGKKYY